jgi:hypothetical protein
VMNDALHGFRCLFIENYALHMSLFAFYADFVG